MKKSLILAFMAAGCLAQADTWDSGKGLGWDIPDAGPEVEWSFNPVGLSGQVVQFDIFMNSIHTWRSDLILKLVDPSDNVVWAHNLEGDDTFYIECFLQDNGRALSTSENLESQATGFFYKPSIGALGGLTFAGSGTWRVRAQDVVGEDVGTIDRIRMHTPVVPEPATLVGLVVGVGALLALRRRSR